MQNANEKMQNANKEQGTRNFERTNNEREMQTDFVGVARAMQGTRLWKPSSGQYGTRLWKPYKHVELNSIRIKIKPYCQEKVYTENCKQKTANS